MKLLDYPVHCVSHCWSHHQLSEQLLPMTVMFSVGFLCVSCIHPIWHLEAGLPMARGMPRSAYLWPGQGGPREPVSPTLDQTLTDNSNTDKQKCYMYCLEFVISRFGNLCATPRPIQVATCQSIPASQAAITWPTWQLRRRHDKLAKFWEDRFRVTFRGYLSGSVSVRAYLVIIRVIPRVLDIDIG